MALPDFFVVGAPKAGTTALHAALDRHPQLYMSPVKEPKFFLCDGRPEPGGGPGDAHSSQEWIWREDEYERLFDDAPPWALRGESTPFYLADLAAHRRIRQAVPNARLIAILRDPVDRAYSNWAHLWADGLETIEDFVAACAAEPDRTAAGWGPFWRYLETGLYGRQLQHLYSIFPRDQVHVIRYKSLVDEPGPTLDQVCRFLGIEEGVVTEAPARNVGGYVAPSAYNRTLRMAFRHGAAIGSHFPPQVWRKASLPLQWLIQRTPQHRPELAESDRAQLVDYFSEDIDIVEEETGWDLRDWRIYREGGTYSVRKSWAPSRRLVS
jgi:Sulfotransferase family